MATSETPGSYISYGPEANCTLEVCPLETSVYRYQPSIPANSVFIALFAIALVAQVIKA